MATTKKLVHKIFHSKLLLFGEHIINKGAVGLAIPLEKYDGVLRIGNLKERGIVESNQAIETLAHYIIHNDCLSGVFDTNQMLEDLERGLYFDSNIPQGYGVGSSGALVAAVYYQYRKTKKKNYVVSELKNELAELESHFHGKSSGLDAIVCYLNKAVLINRGEVAETFILPKSKNEVLKLFLLDTRVERKTSPYVNLFLEKCKDKKFLNTIEKGIVPSNNIAIESFLGNNYVDLMRSVKIISQLQLDLFNEFIPKRFHGVWLEGLKHNNYHLKICGAGGGGFIIGFAKADADLSILLNGYECMEIMKF